MRHFFISLILLFLASFSYAQNIPTEEEVVAAINEGPGWKVYKIRNQLLAEKEKVDSSSADYIRINCELLKIYFSMVYMDAVNATADELYVDMDAVKATADELYPYIQSKAGRKQLKSYGFDDLSLSLDIYTVLTYYYTYQEDYANAYDYCRMYLKFAKGKSDEYYYGALELLAKIQNELGEDKKAYNNIKKSYNTFNDSDRLLRENINTTYLDVLNDRLYKNCTNGKIHHAKRCLKEIRAIFDKYPGYNTHFTDNNVLLSIVDLFSSNQSNNSNSEEILNLLLKLDYETHLTTIEKLGEVDDFAGANEYCIVRLLNTSMDAIDQKKYLSAKILLSLAEQYTSKDVAEKWQEKLLEWSIYNNFYGLGEYKSAFENCRRLISINESQESDEETIKNRYLYTISTYDRATWCNRYFYARQVGTIEQQDTSLYIQVVTPKDMTYILNSWDEISTFIVEHHGKDYLNDLIKTYNPEYSDLGVFPLYSPEDTELMRAHNYVRAKDYTNALATLSEIVITNSLQTDSIIDIIWRIDNNLYLNSGYIESDEFLKQVSSAEFIEKNHELIDWVNRERERIKDWAGYAIGYAHDLAKDGKIDEANKEYDIILEQIQGMEKRDSLYLEVQIYRAFDLYSANQITEARGIAENLYILSYPQYSNNYLRQNNILWLLVKCLYTEGNYSKALSYCKEYLSLLTAHPTDPINRLYGLQLKAEILMALKDYDAAESTFLTCIDCVDVNNLDDNSENDLYIYYQTVLAELAKLYSAKIDICIEQRNWQQCIDLYSKAVQLFKANSDIASVYISELSPFSEQTKSILNILPMETVPLFCDLTIDLQNIMSKGLLRSHRSTKEEYLEGQALALNCLGNNLLDINCKESTKYYTQALMVVHDNNSINWQDYEATLYSLLSQAEQRCGNWVKTVNDMINAFKSANRYSGVTSEESKQYFFSLWCLIENALAAGISNVYQITHNENNPHLSYEQNLTILNNWRNCLKEIANEYGEKALSELQEYSNHAIQLSYKEQFGTSRPEFPDERLTYLSRTYYTEALLNIMANQLAAYKDCCKTLLYNITPIKEQGDVQQLRYDLITSLASSLEDAGYYQWGIDLLYQYRQYLLGNIENFNVGLYEKITTIIGFSAYNIGDMDNLFVATSSAQMIADNPKDYEGLLWTYWDINELIKQLTLLSRYQEKCGEGEKAKETLLFAKELVEKDVSLQTGENLTNETKANLYNDLAAITSSSAEEQIEYTTKAIEYYPSMTYSCNLANAYSGIGEFEKSDSILVNLYQEDSQTHDLPTKLKRSILGNLIDNMVSESRFTDAQYYSSELLSLSIEDYIKSSQALTSSKRNNYWGKYNQYTLVKISSIDFASSTSAVNSYNAALFQKSILTRQKNAIKNNILNSDDTELKNAFDKYNQEIRSLSDSAYVTESYCMYLYSLHPEFVQTFKIPQWQDVKSSLRKSEIAIEFSIAIDFETNELYFVALLLRSNYNNPIIVKLCKCDELRKNFTETLDRNGFSKGLYQDNSVIYNLIWEPVIPYLKGIKTIHYAPYGELNNINLEIAAKKDGGKMLNEFYNMYRVSSTSELIQEESPTISDAVIFGDIDYNAELTYSVNSSPADERIDYSEFRGSMGGSWMRLPNTRTEMEDIQKQLTKNDVSTTIYSGDKATEGAFKSISGSAPDILHIATHGFYFTQDEASDYQFFSSRDTIYVDSGIRSGLILSGANHAWNGESVPPSYEDGILTSDEISGMDLSGTDILTLSACQTALGDLASDGIYGMQRSFKIAGVNTIVMSLWQVDDEATYMLMNKFYEALANGKEKHAAFRLAQKHVKEWADMQYKERVTEIEIRYSNLPDVKAEKLADLLPSEYYWAAFIMLD